MDPITLLVLGMGALAAAGLGAAAGPLWGQVRLRRARELVTRPLVGAQAGDGAARSVHDLYFDLGSSEYAIEVLRHLDLIPETEADVERVAGSLVDAIASFGGYDAMVASLRETIKDLADEAGRSDRGRLTLMAPKGTDSLLPAFGRASGLSAPEELTALPPPEDTAGASPSGDAPREEGGRLHATVDEALRDIFGGTDGDASALSQGAGGVAAIVIGGVLGSLTTGGFWDGVSKFVQRQRVKQMRSRLSQELAGLSLDLFHAPQEVQQRVERNLDGYLKDCRWEVERQRRGAARHRRLPREQRSTAQLALKLLAARNARDELSRAERDIRQLQTQVTRHRRAGRHDLAGFLMYVNRETLLRGLDELAPRLAAIEESGEQRRQALLAETPQGGRPSAP